MSLFANEIIICPVMFHLEQYHLLGSSTVQNLLRFHATSGRTVIATRSTLHRKFSPRSPVRPLHPQGVSVQHLLLQKSHFALLVLFLPTCAKAFRPAPSPSETGKGTMGRSNPVLMHVQMDCQCHPVRMHPPVPPLRRRCNLTLSMSVMRCQPREISPHCMRPHLQCLLKGLIHPSTPG